MATLDLAYANAHKEVRATYGDAKDHVCECGQPAFDWSHTHGTDPDNPASYEPRCRPCHFKYDEINRGSSCGTSKLVEAEVLEIRDKHAAGRTGRSLALEYGVSESQMSAIVNRKAWAWL